MTWKVHSLGYRSIKYSLYSKLCNREFTTYSSLLILPNIVRRANHYTNSAHCRWSLYLFHNTDGFCYYYPPIVARRLLIVSFT